MLFIGIFITMQPALMLLQQVGPDLGLNQPWQLFWATGALSSFLDNTPTYLVFLTTAGTLGFTSGDRHQSGDGSGGIPVGDLLRRRVHGRQHLHRKRAELYGEIHLG